MFVCVIVCVCVGNVACEAVSGGWDQSLYLQQRLHELKDLLTDFSPPVRHSALTSVICCFLNISALLHIH